MPAVFLYGTLCHTPLRNIVLGSEPIAVSARLVGHRVCKAPSGRFPLITESEGASAEGLLFVDLSQEAIERMDYYERAFGCQLGAVEVQTGGGKVEAQAYFPPRADRPVADAWDLENWAARWGEISCMAAEEIMTDRAARSPDEVGHRHESFLARAQARINARKTAPTTLRRKAEAEDIQLRQRKLAYSQFFSVEEFDLNHRQFAGGIGPKLNRAAFISADAITVLPYDPTRDRVMLVEQFRAGPFARGDAQPWMLEPIAGRIDAGESPEEAAHREAAEETGLKLQSLRRITQYYPTPGAKTEYLFAFIATADLADEASGIGGVPAEGEDIRSHVISFDHAMELVESGEINVGPLILLLLHLARLRPELRRDG